MDVGSRRLVARNRFRNTSNAFTGIDWRWRGKGDDELRLLYTLPITRLPSEDERVRRNDIEFDEESFDRQFWGLYFEDALPFGWEGRFELYLFGLHLDDAPRRPRDPSTA